jgi:hypothetical protein
MPARNATTSSRRWCAEATRRSARRATARNFSVGCRCLLPTPMVIRAELRPHQSAPVGAAVIRAVRDRVRLIKTRGLKPALYESGNRVPNPASRIPNPESRIPSPESRVPNPESRVPNPASRIPSPESRIPSPESRVPSPEFRIPNPESRVNYSQFPPVARSEVRLILSSPGSL